MLYLASGGDDESEGHVGSGRVDHVGVKSRTKFLCHWLQPFSHFLHRLDKAHYYFNMTHFS